MNFKILKINPTFEKIADIKAEEAMGMPVGEFVPEEYFKDFKKKGVPVECVYCCDMSGNHTCP